MMIVAGAATVAAIAFLLFWIYTMDRLDDERFQHDNTKHRLDEKKKLAVDLEGRLVVQKGMIAALEDKCWEADQQNIIYSTIINELNKHLDDFPRRGADGKFVKNPEADGKAEIRVKPVTEGFAERLSKDLEEK
jgi:hypothetical protein